MIVIACDSDSACAPICHSTLAGRRKNRNDRANGKITAIAESLQKSDVFDCWKFNRRIREWQWKRDQWLGGAIFRSPRSLEGASSIFGRPHLRNDKKAE